MMSQLLTDRQWRHEWWSWIEHDSGRDYPESADGWRDDLAELLDLVKARNPYEYTAGVAFLALMALEVARRVTEDRPTLFTARDDDDVVQAARSLDDLALRLRDQLSESVLREYEP
jgi:hypothetical protein